MSGFSQGSSIAAIAEPEKVTAITKVAESVQLKNSAS